MHLYWCMKNCEGNPDNLRRLVLNIAQHYQVEEAKFLILIHSSSSYILSQGIHTGCHPESFCHHPEHSSSRVTLTDTKAIDAYTTALQRCNIYRYAESYCRVSINDIFLSVRCSVVSCAFMYSVVTPTGWNRSITSSSCIFQSASILVQRHMRCA